MNIITPLISVQLYSHHTTHKQQSNSSIVRTYNHTRGTYYTLILSPIQATALPANLPTTYVYKLTLCFFPPICFICKNIQIYFHHLRFTKRTKSGINTFQTLLISGQVWWWIHIWVNFRWNRLSKNTQCVIV